MPRADAHLRSIASSMRYRNWNNGPPAEQMDLRNRFLNRLPDPEREILRPLLRQKTVQSDQTLAEQNAKASDVWFPMDAQLIDVVTFANGVDAPIGLTGCEGGSPISCALAETACAWRVRVHRGGDVWCVEASALRELARERSELMAALLRLVAYYQARTVQTAACIASHPVLPRLARWLLEIQDLSGASEIRVKQEELARLLNAQRTTVNEAAGALKRRNLIDYRRGVMRITNLPALADASCGCHASLKRFRDINGLGR